MNRQARRNLIKQDKEDLVKKISQLSADNAQLIKIKEQEINRRAKNIASTVLVVQLIPLVQQTLKEDFNFSDEDIKKFNELYQNRVNEKLDEIDKKYPDKKDEE